MSGGSVIVDTSVQQMASPVGWGLIIQAIVIRLGPSLLHCTSNFPLEIVRGCKNIHYLSDLNAHEGDLFTLGIGRLLSKPGVKVCLFIQEITGGWTGSLLAADALSCRVSSLSLIGGRP